MECYEKLGPMGHEKGIIQSEDGYSPLECFFLLDSRGEMVSCNDVDTFNKVWYGKTSFNWHLTNWIEEINKGLLFLYELQEDPKLEFMPDKVWDKVRGQTRPNNWRYKLPS